MNELEEFTQLLLLNIMSLIPHGLVKNTGFEENRQDAIQVAFTGSFGFGGSSLWAGAALSGSGSDGYLAVGSSCLAKAAGRATAASTTENSCGLIVRKTARM